MRIIHISDIHYKNSDKEKGIIENLIQDLKSLNDKKKIDLLLITGDLINRGGENCETTYNTFLCFKKNILDVIVDNIKINKENILFCPGNHDIDRNQIDEYLECGLSSKLSSIVEIDKFINERYEIYDEKILRIRDFKDFEREFHKESTNCKITNFQSNYIIQVDKYKIGITSFNSSWRCVDKEDKYLLLGTKQIEDSKDIISQCDIKIALMHHSFEFFQEFERREISKNLTKNYDYLFLGHVHTNDFYMHIGLLGSLFVSTAQSNSVDNEKSKDILYSMGYNVLDLDFEKSIIKASGRRYSSNIEGYISNVDVFTDCGYKDFKMLLDDEKNKKREIRDLLEIIQDVHMEEYNKHLLSFKTDSNAPKTINEMFILPTILGEKEKQSDGKKKEKHYSVEDICSIEESNTIFGVKEAGKTILLDMIMIEFVNKFDKYQKLPVRIDLNDMNSTNILTEVKRYLMVKKSKLTELLESNSIVLLIDNLKFSNDNIKTQLIKLNDFLSKYKNVRAIAMVDCLMEREVPIEFINNEVAKIFTKNLYITSWKTDEIERIIDTWFCENSIDTNSITVRKIVNIFNNIRMPVNPLNISMFLWIIEHNNEYQVVNKGELLECFFEHLLDKIKDENIDYNKFNYKNKIRLLAHIAHQMFINESNKYKIEYIKLLELTKEYLKNRKFIGNYTEIINFFISKGIFIIENINEDRYVVFRFECFYRYFIAKHMTFNKTFREFAFEEDNYLKFQDEIDYLTGINNDEVDILTMLTDRMDKYYSEFHEIIYNGGNTLDSYFAVSDSIVDSLNEIECDNIKKHKEKVNSKELYKKKEDNRIDRINNEIAVGKVEEQQTTCMIDDLYGLWTLVAKVLKNTEEIDQDIELKNEIYRKVLHCSGIYFVLYKYNIDSIIEEKIKNNPEKLEYQIFRDIEMTAKLMPVLNADQINYHLATEKLEIVVEEEVKNYLIRENPNEYTELEGCISLILLLKINEKKAIHYVSKLINKYKNIFIKDLLYIGLLYYYYNTRDKNLENKYLNLISDLKLSREKRIVASINKPRIIEQLKEIKSSKAAATMFI